MSWSYDETDLDTETSTGRLNSVRFLVGDTITTDQQVQDEEIQFALVQTGNNTYNAASFVANTIASKYSRLVTTELDGVLKSEYGGLSKNYKTLANSLKSLGQKFSGSSLGVASGGLLISAINTVRENTNRVPSSFTMDRFRYPNLTGNSDYEL